MTPQRIPPELLATTPPTVQTSVLAGSGPSLRPWGGEDAVGVAEDRPRLHPRPGAVVLDPDAAEVLADVDEDAVALALAVEAGAAGAEGDGDVAFLAEAQDPGDVVGVAGLDHRAREAAVGAGVGGVGDEVAGAVEDAVGTEQPLEFAAQRLGDAGGDPVRSAIGDRLARRRQNRAGALQQSHGVSAAQSPNRGSFVLLWRTKEPRHQKRDMPGATGTSTSSGCEEARAAARAPATSSRSRARCALTP